MDDPLSFIKECVADGRVYWTYHVNMRLRERAISRTMVLAAVDSFEIIESYPLDKFLPSYLVYGQVGELILHILFALDADENNVRVVTAYLPDSVRWKRDMKTRKRP